MYIYTHTHTYIYAYIDKDMHIYIYSIYSYMYVCVCVCVCVCMHIYIRSNGCLSTCLKWRPGRAGTQRSDQAETQPAYVSIRQHTSACIRQHTSNICICIYDNACIYRYIYIYIKIGPSRNTACVHQHTSACIRQHTSAYVIYVRQHTSYMLSLCKVSFHARRKQQANKRMLTYADVCRLCFPACWRMLTYAGCVSGRKHQANTKRAAVLY
jgi:hypothetical protein